MLALHQKVISIAFISWFENWEKKIMELSHGEEESMCQPDTQNLTEAMNSFTDWE